MGLAMDSGLAVASVKTTFSSLFIGMGLAIPDENIAALSEAIFQFPFHRDGPCDARGLSRARCNLALLSVPFSSGWALRLRLPDRIDLDDLDFQFPFHRDGPCDKSWDVLRGDEVKNFQFPFHRDGPCDR